MKVSLAILREMADVPQEADVVAAAMNQLGMPVEEIVTVTGPIAQVVAARVVRTERHPDAAKVTRVWVDAGDGTERHVWCGATNMGAGDVVPLALPGATLPDGRTIGRRAILGIESEGMLCSPSEIGVAGDDAGLLILPSDAALGVPAHSVLGITGDTVFDLDLTRNRPECWGHTGVARDLAAHFGAVYRGPVIASVPAAEPIPVEVTVEDPACGMFAAVVMTGIRVGPSPGWVRARLESLGMRSINNVVDTSNLVMLECNQPNHAYDRTVVRAVRVRRARPGETLVTLDGANRALHSEDLLICDDNDHPVGMAGVMGGEHSEVTDTTTEIVLEIAWFDPDTVRFAAQRHGLRSEASARFERGVDPRSWPIALARFSTILSETCPQLSVHEPASVARSGSCPEPVHIRLRHRTIERTLGRRLETGEVAALLGPIGFGVDAEPSAPEESISVEVPTWRPDCTEEVDLVEEIARHLGYDSLGKKPLRTTQAGRLTEVQQRRRRVRTTLVGLGLDEAMPSPFLAPGDHARCGLDEDSVLRLANPLATEESVLRVSLRPGLIGAAVRNIAHRGERIRLWEIGHCYPRGGGPLPDEFEQLGVLVVGGGVDDALEQWLVLSDALGVGAQIDQTLVPPGLHPGRSASLTRGKAVVGAVGEIHPGVARSHGIKDAMSWLECNLSVLLAETPKIARAKPVSRLPSADVDLSFTVPASVTAADLHRALRQAGGSLVADVALFDIWRDGDGTRALAFRLRLQPAEHTLTEEEISRVRTGCITAAARVGAVLRGAVE